jgi:purine-binding chemotaxis protein CheW
MSTPQWVVFRLDAGQYALPLEHVVEVLRMVAIRPVPEGPAWLAGVINLRGRVLPIMDLRTRLGLPPLGARLETRIIVTDTGGFAAGGETGGQRLIGLLADEVLEVLTQPAAPIDLPRGLPGAVGRPLAAVQVGDRLVTVFDLERLGADAQALPRLEAG